MAPKNQPPAALLAVPGVRSRPRAGGGVSVWWQPSAAQRREGLANVRLDDWDTKPTATLRTAQLIAAKAARATATDQKPVAKQVSGNRTIGAACQNFLRSERFENTSDAHQKNLRYDCRQIEARWSGWAVARIDPPALYAWYDELRRDRTARMANRLINTMSLIFNQAIRDGWRTDNPRKGLDLGGNRKKTRGRLRIATWAEVDCLRQAALDLAMPNMALVIGLGFFQGQRPTDIRTARARDFSMHALLDDQDRPLPARLCWDLDRSKRGTISWLAVHTEIAPEIAAMLATRAPDQRLILRDADGVEMTEDQMIGEYDKVRAHAALSMPSVQDITMRLLRRSFSATVRESGIDMNDTDDALGNTAGTNPALRQAYNPASDRSAARAIDALRRPGETMSPETIRARLAQLDQERDQLLAQLAIIEKRTA